MDFLGDPPMAALLDDPLFHLPDLPEHSSLRIPPLQEPVPFHPHSRPSPLEPSAGGDREAQNSKAKLSSQNRTQNSSANTEATNGGGSLGYDGNTAAGARPSNQQLPKTALPLTISLRVLEKKGNDLFDGDGPRKRVRLDDGEKTSDFVKLPKPRARAQKDQQVIPTFGPFTILNGLVEPPPNAALLPPIESDSLTSTNPFLPEASPPADLSIQEKGKELEHSDDPSPPGDPLPTAELQVKTTRTRRKFCKWSSQETNDLLQGVAKYGIGNWKLILEHPDYHFNNRNPTDLKDRFRVCCPDAYHNRSNDKPSSLIAVTAATTATIPKPTTTAQKPLTTISTSRIHTSNILLPQSPSPILEIPQPPTPTNVTPPVTTPGTSKSKAHALTPSALSSLGITTFTPSARRSRRPFTPAEDDNLLRGIAAHGFSWSVIQKDNERYGLGHRRSTDLRDRIRNKWPEWYAGTVPGPVSGTDPGTWTKDKNIAEVPTPSPTKVTSKSANKTNRKASQDQNQNQNQNQSHATSPTNKGEGPKAEASQAATKDLSTYPSALSLPPADLTQLPMPSLTTPIGYGMGMGMGMGISAGYELPAISAAVGEHHLHLLDDGTAGADAFDWDNTLPRLMMWDDMGIN